MILCWPAEILLYHINDALRDASHNASNEKSFRQLHWRARWRIKIWISADWFHYWKWKYYIKSLRYGTWEKRLKNLTLEEAENMEKGIKKLNSLRQKD